MCQCNVRTKHASWTAWLLLSLCACAPDVGRVTLELQWGDDAPIEAQGYWIHSVVEDGASEGRVIASAVGPLADLGVQITGVPYGDARRVVVEIRDGIDRGGSIVAYRGRSAPFDFSAGDDVVAQVELHLELVPQVPLTGGIAVVEANEAGFVTQPDLVVRVRASRASTIVVADNREFVGARRHAVDPGSADEITTHRVPVSLDAEPCTRVSCVDEVHTIHVKVLDAQGYESRAVSTRVVLDRKPPFVVGGSFHLAVARTSDNPVQGTGAFARPGSTVHVELVASERLVATPRVSAMSDGGELVLSERGSGDAIYRFDRTISATMAPGQYAVRVEMKDRAGLVATSTFSPTTDGLVVDSVAPPAPRTELMRFVRANWGTSGGSPIRHVEADPTAAEPGAVAIVLDGEDLRTAIELGRGEVRSDGGFGPIRVDGRDRTAVYVAIADAAGNHAPRATLTEIAIWIASLGGKLPGMSAPNPHRLVVSRSLVPSVDQDPRVAAEPSREALSTFATRAIAVEAPARWDRIGPPAVAPLGRDRQLDSYDLERGRYVMFGGRVRLPTGPTATDEIWEHDGARWREVQLVRPERPSFENTVVRFSAPLGIGFMRSGTTGQPSTWTYDGSQFDLQSTDPHYPHRGWPVMSYDATRRQMVQFGGLKRVISTADPEWLADDTWISDGTGWREVSSGPRPPGRYRAAMAHHAASGLIVLHGGSLSATITTSYARDTWLWDGQTWTRGPDLPEARDQHAMAYDPIRERVVMFGGVVGTGSEPRVSANDVWEFDGVRWTEVDVPEAKPTPRFGATLTYDPKLGGVVMYGGNDGRVFGYRRWLFDGHRWITIDDPVSPGLREDAAMTYHDAGGHLLLFGGRSSSAAYATGTWRWDGDWTEVVTAAQPSLRDRAALAYDAFDGTAVLFGGHDESMDLADTWRWDGADWSEVVIPGAAPAARRSHAMATGTSRGVVLFGGATDLGDLDDTWTLDGSVWTPHASAIKPAARRGAAMAYDAARQRVVLFGGVTTRGDGTDVFFDDMWKFDGTSWTEVAKTGDWPSARATRMAYDPVARQIAIVGGLGVRGPVADGWIWDGTQWRSMDPDLGPPAMAGHCFSIHAARGAFVVHGRDAPASAVGATWVRPGAPDRRERPGVVLTVQAGAAAVDIASFESIAISGAAAASPAADLLVEVWDRQFGAWSGWFEVISQPGALAFGDERPLTDPARWISPSGAVHVRVGTKGDRWSGDAAPAALVQNLEVRVTYRAGTQP